MQRAKIAQPRVRMEGWRQRRPGSNGKNPQEEKEKNTLDSYRPSHRRSWQPTESNGYFRVVHNPHVIAHGYFGTVDEDSEYGILRPASVYSPKKRIVAIASKETGTHIPFSCANCIVR
jgi:hypothetical protein